MSLLHRVAKRISKPVPWVAGLLNFFGPGLGYIYARKRKFLGIALITFFLTILTASGALASGGMTWSTAITATGLAYLFVSVALARDAYLEAKARNREVEE